MRRRFLSNIAKPDNYCTIEFLESGECGFVQEIDEPTMEKPVFPTGLYISYDCVKWELCDETKICANKNQRVYLKSNYIDVSNASFYSSVDFNLRGNILSLIYLDDAEKHDDIPVSLSGLFSGSNVVKVSPNFLPAVNLVTQCYAYMFSGCSKLIQPPILPANKLTPYCYSYMFYNCVSLEYMPELHATQLAESCYAEMFSRCSSLAEAKDIPSEKMKNSCCLSMFEGCTSLAVAPKLPSTHLALNCYEGMFRNCSSLIKAPDLPAIVDAQYCYKEMFFGCTNLDNTFKIMLLNYYNEGLDFIESYKLINGTIYANEKAEWDTFTTKMYGAKWEIIPAPDKIDKPINHVEINYKKNEADEYVCYIKFEYPTKSRLTIEFGDVISIDEGVSEFKHVVETMGNKLSINGSNQDNNYSRTFEDDYYYYTFRKKDNYIRISKIEGNKYKITADFVDRWAIHYAIHSADGGTTYSYIKAGDTETTSILYEGDTVEATSESEYYIFKVDFQG